jgi:superfamily II DNA/RNA helicase
MNTIFKLEKLGVEQLNEMQNTTYDAVTKNKKVILLSPTGSGKTLAFLLPLLEKVNPAINETQMLVIAPTRELAQQSHEVLKTLGTGLRVSVVYGGRKVSYEKQNFKSPSHVVIGTPGRIIDHFDKDNISTKHISNIVVDEYDKCLEIGFEDQLSDIFNRIEQINSLILTSATELKKLPLWLGQKQPLTLDFLDNQKPDIHTVLVHSLAKDKLETLGRLLLHTQDTKGIVFCNFRESLERVSTYLHENNIAHSLYHGGLEQIDREISLLKFRNGTTRILLSTDLAARGLDIPDIDFITHYHLPLKEEEYTHRNGRTARMLKDGLVYVLHWPEDPLPEFILADEKIDIADLPPSNPYQPSEWATLQISIGRKDKVSKADVLGFVCKKAQINIQDIGKIEIKDLVSYLSVKVAKVKQVITATNNNKLKVKNVKVKQIN